MQFLGNVWNGFVNFVISAFSAFSTFFGKLANLILKSFTTPLELAIQMINLVIKGMNLVPGVNIPLIPSIYGSIDKMLPKFADGGTLNMATALIAGEAGTETIVPHNNKPRSQMLALTAMQGAGLSVGGNTYIFSPQISGGNDIKQVMRDSFEEFKTIIERYDREKGRVSFV
jgi:hypothetical protein